MSRISLLLVAAAVAAGVVGCAQCDTCDDFPAPCTGPNCGQGAPGILDLMPPAGGPGSPMMGQPTQAVNPTSDMAGPAPSVPNSPPTPSVDPVAPAAPMESAPKPN